MSVIAPFRRSLIAIGLVAACLAATGCTPSTRDLPPAAQLGPTTGYYRGADAARIPGREPALPGRYMVLAFSGGGTRAAALAHGALRELEATPSPHDPGLTLLDAVDMVSSTSGGSVAAANFVLHGRSRYRDLDAETGFLRHNGIAELAAGVLNPVGATYFAFTPASRIELLSDMLARKVFGRSTFQTLQDQRGQRPPLLVLNAADMASGERFGFTQRQLDLLCLDLLRVRVADAVTASAAFPVLLTPLPLPNHSPCPAQLTGPGMETSIEPLLLEAGVRPVEPFLLDDRRLNPKALSEICTGSAAGNEAQRLPLRSRALRQMPMLNLIDPDRCGEQLQPDDPRRVRRVHLLDGGTADNLGLAAPLETLTGGGDDPRVRRAMDRGEVQEIVVLAVNARSQGSTSVGRGDGTPGWPRSLLATISAAIDGRSGGLLAQLDTLPAVIRGQYPREEERPAGRGGSTNRRPPRVTTLAVDFEMIHDARCRAAFQGIGTSWTNSEREVIALQEMASALLRSSQAYLRLAGLPPEEHVGRARETQACARLLARSGPPSEPPPVFGSGTHAPPPALTSQPASSRG